MDDRELLEAAAKAADLHITWWHFGAGRHGYRRYDQPAWVEWNPLTDDGDALRLAAKLYLHKAIAEAHRLVDDKTDIYAATRLAIVMAAAALASQEPK